jgi:hypothetical protein
MKRLLALLLLSAPAFAAGPYSIVTTAPQDAKMERARLRFNGDTCKSVALPKNCTQPQARTAFCVLTTNQAVTTCPGAAKLDIYADVAAFLQGEVVKMVTNTWGPGNDAADAKAFSDAMATATPTQKDALCADLGLAAGCMP